MLENWLLRKEVISLIWCLFVDVNNISLDNMNFVIENLKIKKPYFIELNQNFKKISNKYDSDENSFSIFDQNFLTFSAFAEKTNLRFLSQYQQRK